MQPAGFASFIRKLASGARRETLARFRQDFLIEDKGLAGRYDPVTQADRAAEAAMRDLISKSFPDHGIYGEEFEDKLGSTPYAWSLDPIDGTRSYMCGLPSWTTLIALLHEHEPVIGLIDAPALDETYIGFGDEAFLIKNGIETPIHTSGCSRIEEARFSTTDPFHLVPRAGALDAILDAVRVTRFGYDGYAYARLAAGSVDLVIESGLKPFDYNAHIPVIRAAGGYIGDWSGGSEFAAGDVIAAASRELYDAAVKFLAEA